MSKIRVLQICSSYFDTSIYKRLFSSIEKMSVVNSVYVPRWHKESNDKMENVYVINKRFSKLAKLLYYGEQDYILKDIEDRINIKQINAIHVHRILYGGYVALKLKIKYGIPYIVVLRNSDLYGLCRNINIYKKHSLNIMAHADKVIYISNTYRDKVYEKYKNYPFFFEVKEKSEVIPNGIDDYFIENSAPLNNHEIKTGIIRIIVLGDVDKNKNALTTLKACKILIEKGYHVEYNYAGIIKDKNVFTQIQKYNFAHYHGVLDKKQVRDLLLKSDVYVMPSIHETFGLVYAEAMSQGIPVIYTKGQGFDGQYKQGEVGFSVNCFDEKEIANRILGIISDYRNLSNRCIVNSQRYNWKDIATRYKEIYEEVLRKDS